MADVYTVTFIMIGILISVPALLLALNLLLPGVTRRAQVRLKESPGKSFWLGLPVTAVFVIFFITAIQSGGPVQFVTFLIALIGMGIGCIGGAAMARLIGERFAPIAKPNSELTNLVRGAVVYELACLVPLVGWFLFIPLVGTTVMGAAVFALFQRTLAPQVDEQIAVGQPTINQVAGD